MEEPSTSKQHTLAQEPSTSKQHTLAQKPSTSKQHILAQEQSMSEQHGSVSSPANNKPKPTDVSKSANKKVIKPIRKI